MSRPIAKRLILAGYLALVWAAPLSADSEPEEKNPRLGDAWMAAIRHYHKKERLEQLKPNNDWYPPSIFFQGMKYMVFGDPSLRLPGDKD
jgi:hypothetical protein